ncbi:MAG: hypothetical protein ABFD89_29170 [Bryobacteraceae bacterium]
MSHDKSPSRNLNDARRPTPDAIEGVLLRDARDRINKRKRLLPAQYEAICSTTALPDEVKDKMRKAAHTLIAAAAKNGKKLSAHEHAILEKELPDVAAAVPRSGAERKHDSISRYNRVPVRQCADVALRKRLEKNPPRWLKTFFPRRFSLPWAPYHRDIISDSLYAIEHGTNQLIVAPRGGGKSRPVMGVVLFSVFTERSLFPVYAPWKSGNVDAAFRFWLAALCNNKDLADLYPEFCDPFRHGKGIAQKLLSLTWEEGAHKGENTGARMAVSDGLIIMPESRGIIGSTTINGNPLGMAFDAPDGSTIRPTIVFIDDPQDDKTASSPVLVEKTIRKVDADIGGMGGPDMRLSMIMCGTTKGKDCVVSHYRKDPEWNVKVTPRVVSWPTGFDPGDAQSWGLWDDWNILRQEGTVAKDGGRKAVAFYLANKEQMISGMEVSWLSRFDSKKGQPDAYYSAMLDFFTLGPRAFASEQQQEPVSDRPEAEYTLTAEAIRKQVGTLQRGQIPDDAAGTVAFVDLNYHAAAWCVLSASNVPMYSVIDYGWWTPGKGKPVWQEKGAKQALEIAIYKACESVVAMLLSTPYAKSLSAIAIDCGSRWAATVHAACKLLMARHNPPPVYAAKGFASATYREPYRRQTIKRRGHLADVRFMSPDREQMMQWDSHAWHMITQRGWLIPIGMPGSLCLFSGAGRMTHAQFAQEASADVLEGTQEKNGKTQAVWKTTGRNEAGDVVAGAAALLSTMGIRPDAADDSAKRRRQERQARKDRQRAEKVQPEATRTQVPPIPAQPTQDMERVKPRQYRRANFATRW